MNDAMNDAIHAVPKSVRELINEWLINNAGWRTGAEIVTGIRLAEPNRPRIESAVYEELGRMARTGWLVRRRADLPDVTGARTIYARTVDVSESLH